MTPFTIQNADFVADNIHFSYLPIISLVQIQRGLYLGV